jgi:tetratricopeptide (TPR) repeat protein
MEQPELATIWEEAKAHIDQGNYEKAAEIYRYMLIRYDDNPVVVEYANAYLGDLYLTVRQLDKAEKHTKIAIKCNPQKPDYHYILGFVYSIESLWTKAIYQFRLSIKVEPDNGEYLRGLGWAVFNGGNKLKGLEYLYKAHEKASSNTNILLDLAAAHLVMFEFEKAKELAKIALDIDSENIRAQQVYDKICQFQQGFKRLKRKGGM